MAWKEFNLCQSTELTTDHRQRLRIRFQKQGDVRWISHRDLLRTFERMFRRAGLSLRMSQGFHPKPKLSFPTALALGVEGWNEVMEFELDQSMDPHEVQRRVMNAAPAGLLVRHVDEIPPGQRKASVQRMCYRFPVPESHHTAVQQAIEDLPNRLCQALANKDRTLPTDAVHDLESATWKDGAVHFQIRASRTASVRPRDVVAALGLSELEQQGYYLARTDVELTGTAKPEQSIT